MESTEGNVPNPDAERRKALADQGKTIILNAVRQHFPEIPDGDIFTHKPPRMENAIGRILDLTSVIDTPEGKLGVNMGASWEMSDQEYSGASLQVSKLTPEQIKYLEDPDQQKGRETFMLLLDDKFMEEDPGNVSIIWNPGKPARVFAANDPENSSKSLLETVAKSLPEMEILKKNFGASGTMRLE